MQADFESLRQIAENPLVSPFRSWGQWPLLLHRLLELLRWTLGCSGEEERRLELWKSWKSKTNCNQQWSRTTESAIFRSLSSAISSHFSLPKRLLSQAFCRADGSLSGLSSQSSTLTASNLRGYLLQPRSKFLINNIVIMISWNVLHLHISCSGSWLFAIAIMWIPPNTLASTGVMVLTQSMSKHGSHSAFSWLRRVRSPHWFSPIFHLPLYLV